MRQFRKRVTILGIVGVFAVSLLAGCSPSMDNSAIVAEVGKDKITLGVANFYARMQQAQYESYFGSATGASGKDLWTQDTGDGENPEDNAKKDILKNLENMYLLKQHAAEYKVELSEDDKKAIDKAAEQFEKDNTLEDKEVVSGSKEYVKTVLELATIQNKMDKPMKAGAKEEVTDEEAAQKSMQYVLFSYNKTDEEGNSEPMSDDEKAEQKKKAQEFADKLKKSDNKDMSAAASEAGQEMQTATFDAKSESPSKDLVKAVDALKEEGEMTDLVETDEGVYIGKLDKKFDKEATDAKKPSIVEERKQKEYDSLLKKWRKDTEITLNKRVWKKISFKKQGVAMKPSTEESTDPGTEESTDPGTEESTDPGTEPSTEESTK